MSACTHRNMNDNDKFSDLDSAIMGIMLIGGAFIFAIGASLMNVGVVFLGVFVMVLSPYPAILHEYLLQRKEKH